MLKIKQSLQCPFKRDMALQNIYTSLKQPFTTQPQIENEDVTSNPRYNTPATIINRRRALSLQELELDDRFLILRIVLETCTMSCMHEFNMSYEIRFHIFGLTSWI